MPRKQTKPAAVPEIKQQDVPDLETQASDVEVQPTLPADHPAVQEQQNKNDRFGKKYTAEQLAIINQFAAALLASSTGPNMHPDAIFARAQKAFQVAETVLPLAQEVSDRESD